MQDELTPEIVLQAYASGIFPMAETRDDPARLLGRSEVARNRPA